MQIVKTVVELNQIVTAQRENKFHTGFVPTMGALHEGHLSLIHKAKKDNDFVIVSIYVNPSQFNEKEDFDKYPRTINADIELIQSKVDVLFAPNYEEISKVKCFEAFPIDDINRYMEGIHRPSHFKGVAEVVYRLFKIVNPTRAYFGEKDYQQLALIKKLNNFFEFNIEIIGCPIIREPSGLAMSSRNKRLSEEELSIANQINKLLIIFKTNLKKNLDIVLAKQEVEDYIMEKQFLLKIEYLTLVEENKLIPLEGKVNKNGCYRLCIAAFVGNIRLIDNIKINC